MAVRWVAGRTRLTAKKKPLESAGCLGGRLYLHLNAEVPQPLEEPLREPGFVALHKVLVAKVLEFDNIPVERNLAIEFVPSQANPTAHQLPVLNAIEAIRMGPEVQK